MKNVGADDEAFEDRDKAVKPQYQTEPPLIMSAKSYSEDWADESDHTSEGRDYLEQAAQNCPERSERDANQLQPDEPKYSDDKSVEHRSSPPVDERASGRPEWR